jgi:hypothetical protein
LPRDEDLYVDSRAVTEQAMSKTNEQIDRYIVGIPGAMDILVHGDWVKYDDHIAALDAARQDAIAECVRRWLDAADWPEEEMKK